MPTRSFILAETYHKISSFYFRVTPSHGFGMISPSKVSSFKVQFSPQRKAALNQKFVTVSMNAADLDALLERKRRAHCELDQEITGHELSRLTLENDKKRIMCEIRDMKSYSSPSPSPSKTSNPLKRSHDMRSFSSPPRGTTTCASSSVTPKESNVQKQKQPEGHREEGFEDDDDDAISIEEAMLQIDTEEAGTMNKDKSTTNVKTIPKSGDEPALKRNKND